MESRYKRLLLLLPFFSFFLTRVESLIQKSSIQKSIYSKNLFRYSRRFNDDIDSWSSSSTNFDVSPTSSSSSTSTSSESDTMENLYSYPLENNPTKRLKALCLHGYLSSGRGFNVQIQKIISCASPFVDFTFIDAPHQLSLSPKLGKNDDLNNSDSNSSNNKKKQKFRWWRSSKYDLNDDNGGVLYEGIEDSLLSIAEAEAKHGPFNILIGHSQGAGLIIALNALSAKPELLDVLLRRKLESSDQTINDAEIGDCILPNADLNIIMSGFLPQDSVFELLFGELESKLPSEQGFPCQSLHVINELDDIVPPLASVQAMSLYSSPVMKVCEGKRHDPSRDDDDVNSIVRTMRGVWLRKFQPPLILED